MDTNLVTNKSLKIFKTVKGKGEDIVLLHGWGCNHNYILPLEKVLLNKYRVTNVDLPGRGQSDWSHDFKDIHEIADSLLEHLPERAIYVGWSFGGLL